MITEIPPAESASTRHQRAAVDALVVVCRDQALTYRAAAAVRGRHRVELMVASRRRSSFAEALSEFLHRPGVAARQRGSVLGSARRSLFAFRSRVLGGSHQGDSLRTCARQEERVEHAYLYALRSTTWPVELEAVMREQLEHVQQSLARMRALRGNL